MKVEKITLNIKYVFGCFVVIASMGAAFANLTSADAALSNDSKSNFKRIDAEVVNIDNRINDSSDEVKLLRQVMATAITDIAVIKSSQKNQERQSREQMKQSDKQMVLLREILKGIK